MRIRSFGEDSVSVKLSFAQASLIRECLSLAIDIPGEDRMVKLYVGSSRAELESVRVLVARIPQNASGECVFVYPQLHAIYASIAHAVVGLPSEEDFHIRTGFYRENAIALARSMRLSVFELLRSDSSQSKEG
ncbi:hypothetical protein AAHZ94_03350 [Streptomyces sp. HSW2009]|uniref:hypothetical protein n=1 Tax=Streptomyces sp. HSW2009 TaxID=3142890 RepID=UPI0032F03F27